MRFTTLSALYELTGYSDRRSVEKFLASINLRLHKIGKHHSVVTEELETALALKYGQSQKQNNRRKTIAANPQEQAFLDDLQKFLSDI